MIAIINKLCAYDIHTNIYSIYLLRRYSLLSTILNTIVNSIALYNLEDCRIGRYIVLTIVPIMICCKIIVHMMCTVYATRRTLTANANELTTILDAPRSFV